MSYVGYILSHPYLENIFSMQHSFFIVSFICFIFSYLVGSLIVQESRKRFLRSGTKWQRTYMLSPVIITMVYFSVVHCCACLGYLYELTADALVLGVLYGVISGLSIKANFSFPIKLLIRQVGGEMMEMWFDNDIAVIEVRKKIARKLAISPSNRILIESGKGKYLDDSSKSLLRSLIDSCITSNLLNVKICTCDIFVKPFEPDPEPEPEPGPDQVGRPFTLGKSALSILMQVNRTEVKFGVEVVLTAKIPNAANDALSFYISPVDLYAAAAPSQQQKLIRFVKWIPENVADNVSVAASGYTDIQTRQSIYPILNGDSVLLECENKYVSDSLF